MKKTTILLSLLVLAAISFTTKAQVLNQPAAWPNLAWTVGGTYTPTGLVNDPTLTSSFTFDDDAAGNGAFDFIYAESPVIDLTAAKNAGETWIYVNGDYVYRDFGGDMLTIDYWNADASSWITLKTFVGNTPNTADYQGCLNMLAYTTATLNINGFTPSQLSGFKYRINYSDANGWQWGWCLGSPTIVSSLPPTCPDPSVLTATTPTSTSAILNWMENGSATTWNIEWDTTGFTPGTGIMINGTTTNPHNLIGLTPATSYQFYVRATCGVGDSSTWVGPLTFFTPCIAVVAPWSENFENAGLIPSCWNQGAANLEPWKFSNTGAGNHIGDNGTITGATTSGGYFAWIDDSSPDNLGTTLVSPLIDVSTLTTPELSFYLLSHNEGFSNVNFSVDVWDGASWHIGFYTHSSNTALGAWENIVVGLTSLTITGNIQLRFVVNELIAGDFYDDVAIDDVNIYEAPSCSAPSNLTALFVSPFNALIDWTENGTATSWQVQWGMAGFVLGTGTIDTTSIKPYMVQPLIPEMAYQFYVRATCGVGDSSTWVGPLTFFTPCVPPTISSYPWTENLDGETVPNIPCGWLVDNLNTDANTWISSSLAANSAPNSLAVSYNASLPANDWVFTPTLNLTGGQTYQLSFAFKAQSATYPEKLKVMYGTAQSVGSMTNMLFDSTFINITFTTATAQFTPSISGNYNIGFHAYSDANMWRIYIDDIMVDMTTSIDVKSNKIFTIFPNPNNGLFNVTTKIGEKATVEVINLQGQVVYKKFINDSIQEIDLRQQTKGVYFVNITTTKGVEVHKIIIQ